MENNYTIEKNHLRDYVEMVTRHSTGKNYVCPICGSGTGPKHTGAFSIDDTGARWKCFACDQSGDIFDLIGQLERLDSFSDRYAKYCEIFGETDARKGEAYTWDTTIGRDAETITTVQEPKDLTDFFLQAEEHLAETDYNRGISEETLKRFHVGFVPDWSTGKSIPSPRLIIPTSNVSYIARDTRPYSDPNYAKMKHGPVHIFNLHAIDKRTDKPVFVVEGELDAMSIIDVGGDAVGLGSTSMTRQLLEHIKQTCKGADGKINLKRPIILAMDNDESGYRAAIAFEDECKQNGVPLYRRSVFGQYKDANDCLMNDRMTLQANVLRAENDCKDSEHIGEFNAKQYLESLFIADTHRHAANKIKTGFEALDTIFNGGISSGLGAISGRSSLGKTTYAWQMACNMAKNGVHVIYWSLEMTVREMIEKSVSREFGKSNTELAHTDSWEWLDHSRLAYLENMTVIEGGMSPTIDHICKRTHEIVGAHPRSAVFIDYLQIIQPKERRGDIRAEIDDNITALYQMSHELDIPVVFLSSVSRANYLQHTDESAIKESGKAEYSCAWMINLELTKQAGLAGDSNANISKNRMIIAEAKAQKIREITAYIVKNREGTSNGSVNMNYYTHRNEFRELTTWEEIDNATKEPPKATVKQIAMPNYGRRKKNEL